MPVTIGEEELKTIGNYMQSHLAEFARNAGVTFGDREVLDRILVAEQELKSQRELMQQGFEQVDKRFAAADERFSVTQWLIGIGFTLIVVLMSIYQFVAGP